MDDPRTPMGDIVALIHRVFLDWEAGWSVGTFGALAEFHHVAGDPPPSMRLPVEGGTVVTARGAMAISLTGTIRLIAYEGLSKHANAWTHGVALCLPADAAAMGGRSVITELGPDRDALREADTGAILFDLGVDAPHVDFCVRTDDPALTATLRAACGRPLLDGHGRAMAAIQAASPDRICRSRLGRIEVYQPIPTGEDARSPAGPHTHLLPDLLSARRTHSANMPIPDGWMPALMLHPAHPTTDRMGKPKRFDAGAHEAFQALIERFAAADVAAEKRRIIAAVLAGVSPHDYEPAETRAARKAARVALRQTRHTHPNAPKLKDWIAAFDRGAGSCDAEF